MLLKNSEKTNCSWLFHKRYAWLLINKIWFAQGENITTPSRLLESFKDNKTARGIVPACAPAWGYGLQAFLLLLCTLFRGTTRHESLFSSRNPINGKNLKASSQRQGFDCEGCEISVIFKSSMSWCAFLVQADRVCGGRNKKIYQNCNYDWLSLVLVLSCPTAVT